MKHARNSAAEELVSVAERSFDNAVGMPPSVFTSKDFLEQELDALFRNEWVCVGRQDAIKNPGDYITYELAGQPIIILRDQSGAIRALSNVCLHRLSVLLEGEGNVERIVCPYHGWTYNLDGTLRAAPFMTRTPSFCKSEYVLPELRCEVWLGWVYVSMNPQIEGVNERLLELERLMSHFGMENYSETFRETHVWNTNWKVLAENFMESYHLPICHSGTVGPASPVKDMVCPPGMQHFNYHWIKKNPDFVVGNAHPENKSIKGEWRDTGALITIYPNHFIALTPGYFWYLILHPVDVDYVHIVYGGGLSPEFMADPKIEEYKAKVKDLLDEVQVEDRKCTERVYRGLRSGVTRPGNLSYLERPNYDFAQYLADRIGGFERTFSDVEQSDDVVQAEV